MIEFLPITSEPGNFSVHILLNLGFKKKIPSPFQGGCGKSLLTILHFKMLSRRQQLLGGWVVFPLNHRKLPLLTCNIHTSNKTHYHIGNGKVNKKYMHSLCIRCISSYLKKQQMLTVVQ